MIELVLIAVRVAFVGVMVVGGALFAFSTFIMAALKRLPDAAGAKAMQEINETVFTPWFMVPFFGTAVLSVGAAITALANRGEPWWLPLLGAGVLYGIGVFVVTAAGNVPLNNQLASIDTQDPDSARVWHRYCVVWTRWNHVRVVSSVGSALLFAECLRSIG